MCDWPHYSDNIFPIPQHSLSTTILTTILVTTHEVVIVVLTLLYVVLHEADLLHASSTLNLAQDMVGCLCARSRLLHISLMEKCNMCHSLMYYLSYVQLSVLVSTVTIVFHNVLCTFWRYLYARKICSIVVIVFIVAHPT